MTVFLQPQIDYTVSGGGGSGIPANALLDEDGNPILDEDGNYIIDEG